MNRYLEGLDSYDQILAEAHRLTELPDWVHYASLAETALTRFPQECPTLTTFWQDTKPSFNLSCASGYLRALEVWKAAPRAVQNRYHQVTHYLAVARDPRWDPRMSKEGVAKMVKQAVLSNAIIFRTHYTGVLHALKALKKNPKLIQTISDEMLGRVYQAEKELLEFTVTEGRKRVIKQQKGAA